MLLGVPIGAFRRRNARRPILKENRRCPNGCPLRKCSTITSSAIRGCGGGGAAALPRRGPRRRASAAQWKDTRAGVAQAALPDENLGSLLVRAAARYRIGSGGRTAGLARVAHGRSLSKSRVGHAESARPGNLSPPVNSLDACPWSSSHRHHARASIQATSAKYETWPRAGSLSGRGLRLQSSVIALAFEIAWLRGERRGERRPSSAGERVGAEAHVDCHLADRQP